MSSSPDDREALARALAMPAPWVPRRITRCLACGEIGHCERADDPDLCGEARCIDCGGELESRGDEICAACAGEEVVDA